MTYGQTAENNKDQPSTTSLTDIPPLNSNGTVKPVPAIGG